MSVTGSSCVNQNVVIGSLCENNTCTYSSRLLVLVESNIRKKTSKRAIANALQFAAAGATPVLSSFNYDAMPCVKSLNLSIALL